MMNSINLLKRTCQTPPISFTSTLESLINYGKLMNTLEEQKEKISFQLDVIRRYDHYIGTTNFKVGLLLSFLVAILAAIILRAVGVSGGLTVVVGTATLVCTLTVLLASIFLIRAVSPNVESASYRSYIFFGDVANWDGGEKEYYSKFAAESQENLLKDVCFQTFSVAKITQEKFRLIKMATQIIIFAVIPSFAVNVLILILEY